MLGLIHPPFLVLHPVFRHIFQASAIPDEITMRN